MLAVAQRLIPKANCCKSSAPKRSPSERLEANVLWRSWSSFRWINEEKDNGVPVRTICSVIDQASNSSFLNRGAGLPISQNNWNAVRASGKSVATTTFGYSGNLVTVAPGLLGRKSTCLSPPEQSSDVTTAHLGLRRRVVIDDSDIGPNGNRSLVVNACEDLSTRTFAVKSYQRRQCLAQRDVQAISQHGARQLKHAQRSGTGFTSDQSFAFNRRFSRIGRLPQKQQIAFFSSEPDLRKDLEDNSVDKNAPDRSNWITTTNRPRPSLKLGTTPVPTPRSPPEVETNPLATLKNQTPKSIARKGMDLLIIAAKTLVTFLLKLPGNMFFYATHPKELREGYCRLRDIAKHEANHYWVGTKLLWADIQTARKLLGKTLEGSSLTRRERKQLLRTVSDLFRLIPFSMFVIIPFMEFALPFALRIFPNMLPSTYQDSLKAEENMKRELKSRIAMASFFQETLEEIAKEQKRKATKRKKELEEAGVDLKAEDDVTIVKQEDSAASMLEFLEKARNGEPVPPDVILRYATYFKDDLTLDNMPRMQLVNMCKYMSIPPYGSDSFLRFQLRHKIRVLKEDDQRILWEGIDSLTKMELREACQERGMRSTGLSKDAYKRSLQQWLDLSVNKDLPISLLIMSRTFFLRDEMLEVQEDDSSKSLSGLADTISGLDKEILNEVILEVATKEEKRSDPEVRKIKLEVLTQQNELIRKEAEARESALKKKEAAEKEKADKEKAEAKLAEAATEIPAAPAPPVVEMEGASPAAGTPAAAEIPTAKKEESIVEEERKSDEERNLSAAEMDAISQLITDDPVHKERKELEKLKALIKGTEEINASPGKSEEHETSPPATDRIDKGDAIDTTPVPSSEPMSSEEADRLAKESLEKEEREAAQEAEASTKIIFDDHIEKQAEGVTSAAKVVEEEEDPIVARLKKRVESMVDKIEVQLTQTKVKIGDKLHYLDKDRDGILNKEEMAEALHHVLKRKISFEEAMEIANGMDENKDGVFTVEELIKWIDEHKLVKFVEEDRDADMDRVVESQASSQQKEEEDLASGEYPASKQ